DLVPTEQPISAAIARIDKPSARSSWTRTRFSLARLMNTSRGSEVHRRAVLTDIDRKSTRLNSSHVSISYAVVCLKKKTNAIVVSQRPDTRAHANVTV